MSNRFPYNEIRAALGDVTCRTPTERATLALLSVLFQVSIIADFLTADAVQALSADEKRVIFAPLGNILLGQHIRNHELADFIRATGNQQLIKAHEQMSDVISYIVSFCDQAGPNGDKLHEAPTLIFAALEHLRAQP